MRTCDRTSSRSPEGDGDARIVGQSLAAGGTLWTRPTTAARGALRARGWTVAGEPACDGPVGMTMVEYRRGLG
ncbi:MAG TPA: hypothetical protein VGO80_20305 [Solirubrobacteraceae bacterium]|nr:hypothetical protein [Solirubrobacteraceae bacterium]